MGARYAIDAMGWDMLMEEGRKGGRGGQLEDEEAHAAVNLVDEPGPGHSRCIHYGYICDESAPPGLTCKFAI